MQQRGETVLIIHFLRRDSCKICATHSSWGLREVYRPVLRPAIPYIIVVFQIF
jgi:hypothetical protein